jgi:ubiquinone/menaquinone biosynthesis C-methylase UbiE
MSFTDLFSEKSAGYAQARPTYPDALYRFIAEAAPGRGRAWDCATGNGQAAIGLARHFAAVEASDASEQQVAHAIAAKGVRYSVQRAEQTDYESRSFDAVCVAQALHWFDLDRFYPEVQRVLKPGGIFAAWGYGWTEIASEIDRAIERHLLAPIKPHWPKQNALLIAGYRTIAFPFEELEVPPMRIETHYTLDEFLAYAETWTATRSLVNLEGRGFLEATRAALLPLWGEDVSRPASMVLAVRCGRHGRP